MITSFKGTYSFLSNFYTSQIELDGKIYPTVEHAYQAAKTTNKSERELIRQQWTPGQAKKAGRHLRRRVGWNEIKVEVMTELVRKKFEARHLRDQLIATGDEELIEGNEWGDTFWGVYKKYGKNYLGRILMQIREEILNG